MSNLLKRGQVLRSRHSGQTCTVEEFLGGGGQGEVYRAQWGTESFALKWYFSHTATSEQQAALEKLVTTHKAPNLNFLWPLDLIDSATGDGFGYVMRLREPRFRGLLDLMMNRVDPSFQALVTAGLQLADSFFRLHADGLCYRDISFGNVFFDPQTGEVLVCDNDNVTENRSPHCGILGTPDFMAPEIVRGEALPSRQTDLYSLAVLLFYMFHVSHPLLGLTCEDETLRFRAPVHFRSAGPFLCSSGSQRRSQWRGRCQRRPVLAGLSSDPARHVYKSLYVGTA